MYGLDINNWPYEVGLLAETPFAGLLCEIYALRVQGMDGQETTYQLGAIAGHTTLETYFLIKKAYVLWWYHSEDQVSGDSTGLVYRLSVPTNMSLRRDSVDSRFTRLHNQ